MQKSTLLFPNNDALEFFKMWGERGCVNATVVLGQRANLSVQLFIVGKNAMMHENLIHSAQRRAVGDMKDFSIHDMSGGFSLGASYTAIVRLLPGLVLTCTHTKCRIT